MIVDKATICGYGCIVNEPTQRPRDGGQTRHDHPAHRLHGQGHGRPGGLGPELEHGPRDRWLAGRQGRQALVEVVADEVVPASSEGEGAGEGAGGRELVTAAA